MSYLKEKVAYLKGLAEGMQISESTNEGKLLKAMIEVMDDMALVVDDIEEVQEQLSEQVDNMDEDLAELERIVFDEDEECVPLEIECPYCNEKFDLEPEMIDDDSDIVECPNCKKEIEIDWDCECEDCCDSKDE